MPPADEPPSSPPTVEYASVPVTGSDPPLQTVSLPANAPPPSAQPVSASAPAFNCAPAPARKDPYAALRDDNYRRYIRGWACSAIGLHMMGAAVHWELYARKSSAMALGLVGLVQALPVIFLALPAGHFADTHDRRRILIGAQLVFAVCALGLAVVSFWQGPVWMIYSLLMVAGCAKAFGSPARGAMLPLLVSETLFENVVTWNSFVFHIAATVGPIGAGLIMHRTMGWPVFLITATGTFIFAMSLLRVRPRPAPRNTDPLTLRSMFAGAGFLLEEKTVLAAITLDLFAVLVGGATTLLPIYAKDILHVGAIGFGALRAAPYVGAFVMAWILAHRPPFERAGRALLLSVACFGALMIVFGLSTSFPLSLVCLLLAGALDNISVVVRHVLVQVRTPNALRGRVAAVNTVFIDSSNELGGFESGLVAKLFNPVVSVVSGGIGTILVVAGIAAKWKEIRQLGRLTGAEKNGD